MGEVLYVSDTSSRRVYRVRNLGQPKDPSRNLEVVAGTGEQCLPFDQSHCGEGRKATEAALNNPRGRKIYTTSKEDTFSVEARLPRTVAMSMNYIYHPSRLIYRDLGSVLIDQCSVIFGTTSWRTALPLGFWRSVLLYWSSSLHWCLE